MKCIIIKSWTITFWCLKLVPPPMNTEKTRVRNLCLFKRNFESQGLSSPLFRSFVVSDPVPFFIGFYTLWAPTPPPPMPACHGAWVILSDNGKRRDSIKKCLNYDNWQLCLVGQISNPDFFCTTSQRAIVPPRYLTTI